MHGSAGLLIAAAVGYLVIERADKHKGSLRRIGYLIGGLIVVALLQAYPLPLPPAYYLADLPARVDWRLLAIVVAMAPFFSMLAAWGPAYQASKLDPMEILRAT